MKYVALLRGINVSGHHRVPMADLKKTLEKEGYKNVKTLLASGNVVFETEKTEEKKLEAHLTKLLGNTFGFPIPTLVRSHEQVVAMTKKNPFKKISVEDTTRLYVTFLTTYAKPSIPIPFHHPEGSMTILEATKTEVFTHLELSEDQNTTDLMKIIEEEFGKNVTTRNWNTVVKISLL